MNIIALAGAGLLMATGLAAAAPADAQRHGYDRHDRGWNGDRHWRGDRGWRGDRRWNRGYGWNGGGRGWNRGGYYRPGRVVCRVVRGYYGPERRCFRR